MLTLKVYGDIDKETLELNLDKMDIEESNVRCFKSFHAIKGCKIVDINLVYFNFDYQKFMPDQYDYIKNNVNNFKEFIGTNNKYLVNANLFAGIKRCKDANYIEFIDGDWLLFD